MKNKHVRLVFEILLWIGFITFPLILFPTIQPYVDQGVINPPTIGIIITHSLLLIFYYFNYYYALPRFYFKRKYKVYFPLVFICLFILLLIMFSNEEFNPLPSPPFKYVKTAFAISIFLRFMMMFLLSLGFATYRRLIITEEEKLKSEISYLKAQINPHFLFNTLNSIYALTVKKSESAPESITKLAAIMRYVITDAAQDVVELEKEINYVSAYIELEKLRITNKVNLQYTVTGNFTGKKISPLIFIPLIENAFKHGVSTSQECNITIQITINSNIFNLVIQNSKTKSDNKQSNGLGISNVKQRLNLLYGGKHELNIHDSEKDFKVNLIMTLND